MGRRGPGGWISSASVIAVLTAAAARDSKRPRRLAQFTRGASCAAIDELAGLFGNVGIAIIRQHPDSAVLQIPGLKAEVDTGSINIDEGIACLIIKRRTWRNGEPITAVRLVHPGPLYDLIA